MNDLPMSMRTSECEAKYQADKKSGNTQPLELVDSIEIFEHWRIIDNDYCYCIGYKRCHMLVIKRADCASWFDVNANERAELDRLKRDYIYENYDQIADINKLIIEIKKGNI